MRLKKEKQSIFLLTIKKYASHDDISKMSSWRMNSLAHDMNNVRNPFIYQAKHEISTDYIMAGRAFVVANEVLNMETVVFWHCDNG